MTRTVFNAVNMTDRAKIMVLLGSDGKFLKWPEGLALSLQEWLNNILLVGCFYKGKSGHSFVIHRHKVTNLPLIMGQATVQLWRLMRKKCRHDNNRR